MKVDDSIDWSMVPDIAIPVVRVGGEDLHAGNGEFFFLNAPIPMAWIATASGLPGQAFQVAIAIRYRQAMLLQQPSFKLSNQHLARFKVSRYAKRRALAALEQAGLIKVERPRRGLPTVTIIETAPSPDL